ncbi:MULTISPECIES: MFS transporter [unclassified Psychrobacillus]|uniref:MFS transporter n=1 Tax=unclassified Psychrobacillus TaxID=2636677 RepID=UPI0011A2E967|nr:MFS transporter [Psychrobacillus sp. AK 1817]QEY22382.1 MFS transporter [Psychrobacillus sp. AK 1817]
MKYKKFILYQGIIGMASSMIFPFYVLLLNNVGRSYSQFGWAYGLFALTAALTYPFVGKLADKIGDKLLLILYSWGMAVILLIFPLAYEIWHVYMLQIFMGILGAVQKNSEKTVLARNVKKESAGKEIGTYHIWTSIAAAVAVIATGYLVDFLTIGTIFYLASIIFAWSGLYILKLKIE